MSSGPAFNSFCLDSCTVVTLKFTLIANSHCLKLFGCVQAMDVSSVTQSHLALYEIVKACQLTQVLQRCCKVKAIVHPSGMDNFFSPQWLCIVNFIPRLVCYKFDFLNCCLLHSSSFSLSNSNGLCNFSWQTLIVIGLSPAYPDRLHKNRCRGVYVFSAFLLRRLKTSPVLHQR